MAGEETKALSLCQKALQDRGYRLTAAREGVVRVLAEAKAGEHLSAEEIYRRVGAGNRAVGLTSIYRALDLLVHLGVMYKFDFGDGRARYELTEGPRGIPHHHHLVCAGCGTILDYHEFIDEELSLIRRTEEWLSERYRFKITGHMMSFHGLCSACCGKEALPEKTGDGTVAPSHFREGPSE
jgi:Fur family ferric uptake transcriptional regulator